MASSVRDNYLATDIMTAAPQKLQLVLIEAAMRSAERARAKWRENSFDQASELLIHAQDILGQLMAGLNHEVAPEVSKRVAAVYVFVFRRLMEANVERSPQKLDDALRVLEIERDTWRQVCLKLGSRSPTDQPSEDPAPDVKAAPARTQPVPAADAFSGCDASPSGLSLEA